MRRQRSGWTTMATGGGDAPPKKKLKLAPDAVKLSETNRILLGYVLDALDDDIGCGFSLLKITNSNVEMCASFKNCFVKFERSIDKEGPIKDVYNFTGVFEKGVDVLKLYLEDQNQVPEDKEVRVALQRLTQTIESSEGIKNKLTKKMNPSETDWTVCLVHHLLKELSVNQHYRIDAFSKDKTDECKCCKEPLSSGAYGDCSLGNSSVWHGRVDILLGPHPAVPVFAVYSEYIDESDEVNQDGSLSSFEVKETSRLCTVRSQIIAETIVFAFLQKKNNPDFENYLIPTVGISREKIVFYLYDPDYDFLLESPEFPIFDGYRNTLAYSGVLALWLVLNYKTFCTGVSEAMRERNFTADILSGVPSDIKNIYKEGLQFGNCTNGTEIAKPFNPSGGLGFQLKKSYSGIQVRP